MPALAALLGLFKRQRLDSAPDGRFITSDGNDFITSDGNYFLVAG